MPPKKAYESFDSDSDCDDKDHKPAQGKKQKLEKDSDEYRQRRERNNIAVRKSREASRKKAKETVDRVKKLRDENDALEQKVTILNKELNVLRDLFLTHASATSNSSSAVSQDVKPFADTVEVQLQSSNGNGAKNDASDLLGLR